MTLDDYAQLLDKYQRLVILARALVKNPWSHDREYDTNECRYCGCYDNETHAPDCLVRRTEAEIGGGS